MRPAAYPRDAILVASVTIFALVVVLAVPWPILRVPAGLGLTLFLPGAALVSLLFPRGVARVAKETGVRRGIDPLERIALAIGLSIAVTPLLGLGILFVGGKLGVGPVAWSTGLVSLAFSIAALLRRKGASGPLFPDALRPRRGDAVAIGLAVLFAGAGFAYGLSAAKAEPVFSAIEISRPDGGLLDSIANLTAPARLSVMISVESHEGADTRYAVHARDERGEVVETEEMRAFVPAGTEIVDAGELSVPRGERAERLLDVPLEGSGLHRVEFRVSWHRGDQLLERDVHVWARVTG